MGSSIPSFPQDPSFFLLPHYILAEGFILNYPKKLTFFSLSSNKPVKDSILVQTHHFSFLSFFTLKELKKFLFKKPFLNLLHQKKNREARKMGCVASKLEEEEQVVSICRERKRQLKVVVERRYTLADSHCRYCKSLEGVAASINLFVTRHCPPSQHFPITFPSPKPKTATNLQQKISEPNQPAIESCGCSTTSDSSEENMAEKFETQTQENVCGYYSNYMGLQNPLSMQMPMQVLPPAMPSPQRGFGWDFFDPFAGYRPEIKIGYCRSYDDDLRIVREEEGIPELEEEETEVKIVVEEKQSNQENEQSEMVTTGDDANVSHGEHKCLSVIDTPDRGRELLEALKDIEDYFIRAFDSGKEVSRMLEANRVFLQSGFGEIKENSSKLIHAISWRSTSFRSSSSKSIVASSSKGSSTWTEFKNDLFDDDDYGGMDSGSHSLTLGRLYAWEKKLYQEVKAGDSTRKIYEKKCNQLSNLDAGRDEGLGVDKTRAAVKDLRSRILVAIRRAESISKQIDKLRDEELHPQIIELLQGLSRTWKIMSEAHEIQKKIMREVKSFDCLGKFSNNTHQRATEQLVSQIMNWRVCFTEYVEAQKAYVESLNGWLTKFVVSEIEVPPTLSNGPPLLIVIHSWLNSIQKLPAKTVSIAIKCFAKDIRALQAQQGVEQQQKRKVDGLSKELDRKILAFQKMDTRVFESKVSGYNPDPDNDQKDEYLKERKIMLDEFRARVDEERRKHQYCIQETQRVTLVGFQTGFSRVFESLTEFSKFSLAMYDELAKEKPAFIEDNQDEDKDGSSR